MPTQSRDWRRSRAPDLPPVSALSQAIDLAQTPRLAALMQRQPLPPDVLLLMRVASRCPEAIGEATKATARDAAFVVAASELYLRQVVCFRGAGPRRTLGAPVSASREDMRLHMRALVRWLHPDRGGAASDAALMQRVLEAWQAVGRSQLERPASGVPRVTPSRRRRRSPTFRPSWISQPLPKQRPPRFVTNLSRGALGLALVILGLVVPGSDVQ